MVSQGSTWYAPIKDLFLYMKAEKKFVKNLEDNLTKMIRDFAIFYSKKERVDRKLDVDVSKEKNADYNVLVKQMEIYQKRYDKYLNKYQRYCRDLPSFEIHEVSSPTKVMDVVQERKPTVKTWKFWKLATLSRKVKELLDEITLVSAKMEINEVLTDRRIQPVQVKYDDINLPSSNEYVNKILSYLNEDENRSIGILGPIGVGKTSIMKKLNNHYSSIGILGPIGVGKTSIMKKLNNHYSPSSCGMIRRTKFELVISIDCIKLEKDRVVEGIQHEIIDRLKLEGEKANNIQENAAIISKFLCDKKYLLLIDNVFSIINLDDIGVHKDHKCGKVVLASSNKKVISPMIDQEVEIKPLSDDDAAELFLDVCGNVPNECIAKNIARSCGGLPLVIKLVANFLKGEKSEEVWMSVKRDLQAETQAKLRDLEGVGHAYKLAYDRLEVSHKKCLLFVALFRTDQKIYKDYLVECWNAERILELDVTQFRAARERGARTLRELTDHYLLENLSDKHVKMSKYMRKVAAEQQYPSDSDCPSSTTTRRMPLIHCMSKPPSEPISNNISTLLMQCYCDLVTLGDLFFKMQNLLILDLHKVDIESLPTSISCLVSLGCLYLNDCCRLSKLPPEVGNLKKLELIDIRGTSFHMLPSELGDMFQLRCLRFSFGQKRCNHNGKCKEVEMIIHPDIISHLRQLEELTIEVGCCNQAWNNIAEQIVTEVACLEKLSTLNFHFPNVTNLKQFVAESKSLKNTDTDWGRNTLRSFNISIGCCDMRIPYDSEISGISPEKRLRLSTSEEISAVEEILWQASSFELVGHEGVKSLNDFDLTNAGTLKVCVVKGCGSIESVVDGKSDCAMLKMLEKLYLFDLPTLQYIWRGPVCSGSLANLKDLTIFGCPNLTTIFNHELARALSSLAYVKVENCCKVVEIINESNVDLSNMLNKVKTVDLVNLPQLQSICKTTTSMEWRSLVKIAIISCNELRDIHFSLRKADKLETIECEESWWTQLPKEQNEKFLRYCSFIVMEQEADQAGHARESSAHEKSNDHVAPKVSVSYECNGKIIPGNENEQLISSTSSGTQDMPESSHGVEHVIHQSTSTPAPTNEEASSLLVGRCSQLVSSKHCHSRSFP